MNPVLMFVLGLLIGWLIEWVIDWFYWRRKYKALEAENAEMKEKLVGSSEAKAPRKKDDLTKIKGIGPVIAKKLNEADILSFGDLASLTADQLRDVVGDAIERLADEDEIIFQAKLLSREKDDLTKIKGIGKVISDTLNRADIFTYRELAAITADQLRDVVGDAIERLADEDEIIEQAKKLANG